MHTIVLATQKGGSGKSTLAIGLAVAAMQDGHIVRLIETDPQGTISNWKRRRSNAEPLVESINNTPYRGQRIHHAAAALGDEAALDLSGILALPYIVMRNDHQDALGAGLAVCEYAPAGKSAEEIRDLWR